jgi:hypothetical protein
MTTSRTAWSPDLPVSALRSLRASTANGFALVLP